MLFIHGDVSQKARNLENSAVTVYIFLLHFIKSMEIGIYISAVLNKTDLDWILLVQASLKLEISCSEALTYCINAGEKRL